MAEETGILTRFKMEEIRIDCSRQTPEELALAAHHAKLVHRFNMAEPYSEEWTELMLEIFKGKIGEGSRVMSPLTAVRPHMVSVGKYAIVGAGSIVTKDVPDYAVAVGNPARVIKYLDKDKFNE